MASLPADEKVQFLLHILANSDFRPDYQAVAISLGINSSGNAQRRFKSIVEADKTFTLNSTKDNVKVVLNNSAAGTGASSSSKNKKGGRTSNKRKQADADGEDGIAKKVRRNANERTEEDNNDEEDDLEV